MGKEQPKTRSLLNAVTEKGFRLTSQRKALIETIQETSQHLDAATLLQLARKRDPRINRATVYRTLELLKKLQLVDELDLMHLAGEKHYYEVRPDRQHVHLACCRCGRIVEFSSETFDRLQSEIAAQTGSRFKLCAWRLAEIAWRASRRRVAHLRLPKRVRAYQKVAPVNANPHGRPWARQPWGFSNRQPGG